MISKSRRSVIKVTVAVAVLALVAAACGSDDPESASLKVGFSGQPDFTQVMNFTWLDTLNEEHGIDAEAVIFEGTSPPFRALVSGDVHMVVGQVPPGIFLRAETGADVVMIAGDVQQSDYLLVSSPDVTSLEDLYGRQIGTAGPGSVSTSLSVAALTREGINIDDLEFVEVGGTGARMAALVSGQTAAGAAHFAEGFNAVEEGLFPLYVIADAVGAYLFHGVWVDRAWLEENPNLAQLAMDEFINSVRWAANNKAEYIAAAEEVTEGLSDAAKSRAYDEFIRIGLFAVNGGLEPALLNATISIEQEVGNLPAVVEDSAIWVVTDLVDDYLERNGRQ
jgi:ABC-type nitrate/sulfonate/bicarbonate transport system substrate-binding protein